MVELIWKLLEPFLGYIVAAAGGAFTLLMVWLKAKNAGRQEERNKQMKESYENERKRNTIEDRVRNASPDERDGMHEPWYRD